MQADVEPVRDDTGVLIGVTVVRLRPLERLAVHLPFGWLVGPVDLVPCVDPCVVEAEAVLTVLAEEVRELLRGR